MVSKIEPILFVLFVFFIIWMTWVPIDYLLKNLKNGDFDFYRDISFYSDTIMSRYSKPVGKIAIFYIVFYAAFYAVKFFFLKGK
jgi:hypothetical protein